MIRYSKSVHGLVWFGAFACTLGFCWTASSRAQDKSVAKTSLTIDSIFAEKQFALNPFSGRWQSDSLGFERIRTDSTTGRTSIVRIGLANPQLEETLVPTSTSSGLEFGVGAEGVQ